MDCPNVKYIVVGRDARDVFMSYWNHYSSYTDAFYRQLNDGLPDRMGALLPRCPQNVHEYWHNWITRSYEVTETYRYYGHLAAIAPEGAKRLWRAQLNGG